MPPSSETIDRVYAGIGIVLVIADAVFFFMLLSDLIIIGNGTLREDISPFDELWVVMMCTAHFPTNTVSLSEMIGRLIRRSKQSTNERDFDETNFSPTWFLVSIFACLYDATGLVRTRIATYSPLLNASTILAVTSSLATAVWAGIVTLRFYILYTNNMHRLSNPSIEMPIKSKARVSRRGYDL